MGKVHDTNERLRLEAEVKALTQENERLRALWQTANEGLLLSEAEVERLRASESALRSMYEEALAERDAGLKRESALEDEVERLRAALERIGEDQNMQGYIARNALAEETMS